MNTIVLIMICMFIIILAAILINKFKKIKFPILSSEIGLFIIIGGLYLFPATMWRTISVVLLIIGVLIVIASIIAMFVQFKGD